jgi:hypothetical protein
MRSKTAGDGGELTVRTARPTRDIEHLTRLLAERLDKVQLLAPVGDLELIAAEHPVPYGLVSVTKMEEVGDTLPHAIRLPLRPLLRATRWRSLPPESRLCWPSAHGRPEPIVRRFQAAGHRLIAANKTPEVGCGA